MEDLLQFLLKKEAGATGYEWEDLSGDSYYGCIADHGGIHAELIAAILLGKYRFKIGTRRPYWSEWRYVYAPALVTVSSKLEDM